MQDKDGRNNQRRWVREEAVILVVAYFQSRHLGTDEKEKVLREVSDLLRKREVLLTGEIPSGNFRDYAGIRMQMSRIHDLDKDPDAMRGTELQKQVVREYLADPAGITAEADRIRSRYQRMWEMVRMIGHILEDAD